MKNINTYIADHYISAIAQFRDSIQTVFHLKCTEESKFDVIHDMQASSHFK